MGDLTELKVPRLNASGTADLRYDASGVNVGSDADDSDFIKYRDASGVRTLVNEESAQSITGQKTLTTPLYTAAVEVVTTTNVITAAESGTTFFLNLAGGFTSTLPAPAAGLYFKFIISTSPTTAYIIGTNAGADIMIGGINELEIDTNSDGPYDANADTFNFVANIAVVGDWVEFISDGTSWFFTGQTNADGGVTTSTT